MACETRRWFFPVPRGPVLGATPALVDSCDNKRRRRLSTVDFFRDLCRPLTFRRLLSLSGFGASAAFGAQEKSVRVQKLDLASKFVVAMDSRGLALVERSSDFECR